MPSHQKTPRHAARAILPDPRASLSASSNQLPKSSCHPGAPHNSSPPRTFHPQTPPLHAAPAPSAPSRYPSFPHPQSLAHYRPCSPPTISPPASAPYTPPPAPTTQHQTQIRAIPNASSPHLQTNPPIVITFADYLYPHRSVVPVFRC